MRTDEIVQKARDMAQLEQFDSESFREGLEFAARAVDANPLRKPEGKAFLEGMYSNNLATRLKLADYARRNPELTKRPIKRPVFVMGMPRTGTTVASYLLGADKRRRSLLKWEVAAPVPPPNDQTLFSNPVGDAMQKADEAAGFPFAAIHYEAPYGPTECTFVMAHDFKSLFVESLSANEDYSNWFLNCDLTSAYEYHRLFLQVLQQHTSGEWCLKLPSHALGIKVLHKMYPDARVIWTHRDPYATVSSLISMISKAEMLTLRESDVEHLKRTYPNQLAEHVRRPMAVQDETGTDPFYHLYYSKMMRDPIAEMRKLYAWLNDDFTPEVEAGMRQWLKDNPQGRFGAHPHNLEKFGLSKKALEPLFADYLKRFDIEMES